MRPGFAVAIAVLAAAACGQGDRCLDQGGRWNASVEVCEFVGGPLLAPGDAITAGKRTLEFAYGSGVLDQEPFLAELEGDVWHVYGTLPRGAPGGVAQAWIELDSGRVRKIAQGR